MTNKGMFMGVATILASGVGLAAVVLNAGSGEITGGPILVAQAGEGVEESPPEPTEAQRAFHSMAVDADLPECLAPRPPRELARAPYVRNGYAAIRTIMAMQRWQETGLCECFSNQITWPEVITEASSYVTSENPLLPFDVVALQKQGAEMAAARSEVCEN